MERPLLHIGAGFLKFGNFITKCERYDKVRLALSKSRATLIYYNVGQVVCYKTGFWQALTNGKTLLQAG